MAQVERRRKTGLNKDFMIIILLVIIIFALTIYIIFSKMDSKDDTTRKNFLSTMQTVQSELSYYVCGMEKDTFGIYTKSEILAGKASAKNTTEQTDKNTNTKSTNSKNTKNKDTNDETEIDNSAIKDNEGNLVTSLVETDKNYGTEENPIYKVNVTDLQKILNVSVEEFKGLEWYIENGTIVKVGFENSKPSWWEDTFDVFSIK